MATQKLSSLLQRTSIDDHNELLQSANAALAKSKSDVQAQHAKVVALVKLDRYDDCLRVFEEGGDALKKRAALEYAYALYKAGRLDAAIEIVSKTTNHRGARHLEAQAVWDIFDHKPAIVDRANQCPTVRAIVPRNSAVPLRSTKS